MAFAHTLLAPLLILYSASQLRLTNPHTSPVLRYLVLLTAYVVIKRIVVLSIYNYKARARNAQLFPQLHTWIPFNIGIIYAAIKGQGKFEPGFIVDPILKNYNTDTINLHMKCTDEFFSKDPLVVKHILTGDSFPNYGKGPVFRSAFQDFLGTGIFNSDPDNVWRFHRNLTKPFFHKERVTDFNLDYIDKSIAIIKQLSSSSPNLSSTPVDMQKVFRRLTLDSTSSFLFGYQFGSLDRLVNGSTTADNELADGNFPDSFDVMMKNSYRASLLNTLKPLYEFICGSLSKRDMAIIHPTLDKIVDAAVQRAAQTSSHSDPEKKENPESHGCFLDYLLTKTNDKILIRDELLNLLIAGRDTTAVVLSSIAYSLAKNPHVYEEARGEVLRLFDVDGDPDYKIMRDSKLLRAIINETLRMFPPVALNTRYAFNDDVITASDGQRYFVPGGSPFHYSLWSMQRDPKNWGPDAAKWDPHRWLDSRIEKMTSNPFIFQPFSAGPRLCLGQQHAYNQMTLVIIRLCQNFQKIELASDVQSTYVPTNSVTLNWTNGMHLRLTPYSHS